VSFAGVGTMSKSKNNGVDPQALIEKYGADTARFYIIFASPPTNTLEWSDESVEGSYRFLRRLWSFAYDYQAQFEQILRGKRGDAIVPAGWRPVAVDGVSFRGEIHSLLKQANYDLGKHQFNTVASAAMKMLNAIAGYRGSSRGMDRPLGEFDRLLAEATSILLRVLAPITPHICHHLWRALGFGEDVMQSAWPEPDAAALVQDEIEYVVQVNGKKKGTLPAPSGLDAQGVEAFARASDAVGNWIGQNAIKRVVVVPGRLINIVV